jgi:hypothetical protein
MRRGLSPVQTLLQGQQLTTDLVRREQRGEGLLARVRAVLRAPVRPHCIAASLKAGELVVTMDSPVWATRLRYAEETLRCALAPAGCERVRIRVRPPGAGVYTPGGRALGPCPRRLSPRVIAHLLEAADGISEPELAQALRRLARRHRHEREI